MNNKYEVTLKNKLNITDYQELHFAIREILDIKIPIVMSLDNFEPTINCLKQLHILLFDSIYDFAGQFREVNITKTEPFLFGYEIEFIDHQEISNILSTFPHTYANTKDKTIKEIVENLTFLWKTHPFRAGNTITCLIFTCKHVEKVFGYNIYDEIKKDYVKFYVALVLSNIDNNDKELHQFFKNIIETNENKIYKVKE